MPERTPEKRSHRMYDNVRTCHVPEIFSDRRMSEYVLRRLFFFDKYSTSEVSGMARVIPVFFFNAYQSQNCGLLGIGVKMSSIWKKQVYVNGRTKDVQPNYSSLHATKTSCSCVIAKTSYFQNSHHMPYVIHNLCNSKTCY